MGTTAAQIVILVTSNADEAAAQVEKLNKSLKNNQGETDNVSNSLTGLKKSYLAVAAVTGVLAAGITDMVKLYMRQEDAEKQLETRIKSTGAAAGMTADELKNLARSLQSVTTYGDEVIMEGQNLLLTFTRIGKEVFPEATETMLDMSKALGQDLKSSAIQLGKALNDPIQGVSALSRVGVQFTKQQEEQIKQYVRLNDIVSAQRLILSELSTQMGGSARAATETLSGKLQQMNNAFGDMKEQGGKVFAEVILGMIKAFETLGDIVGTLARSIFPELRGEINGMKMEFGSLAEIISTVIVNLLGLQAIRSIEQTQKATEKYNKENQLVGSNMVDLAQKIRASKKSLDRLTVSTKKGKDTFKEFLTEISKAGAFEAAFMLIDRESQKFLKEAEKRGIGVNELEAYYTKQRVDILKNALTTSMNEENLDGAERMKRLEDTYRRINEITIMGEEERTKIQKQYDEMRKNAQMEAVTATFGFISSSIGQISELYSMSTQNRLNELEYQRKKEKSILAKQLEQGLISKDDYEAKAAIIDQKYEDKKVELQKKAFEITKRLQIAEALMAIPGAAIQAYKAMVGIPFVGPALAWAAAIAATAFGMAKVALISEQQFPAAQFGGSFMVPPGNQADSGLLRVNQGERVDVSPSRFSGLPDRIILQVGNREMEAYITDTTNRNFNAGKIQIRRRGAVKTA